MGVRLPADLAVTKQGSSDPVFLGDNLTYTIPVTNNGPFPATGVTLIDTLPSGVTLVSASPGCTESAGIVTCAIGSLEVGGTENIEIVVQPNSLGTIINTATVRGNEFDPNPANNTATESTSVQQIRSFFNETPIVNITDDATTPYPSEIVVTGLEGTIAKVHVTINNFNDPTGPPDHHRMLVVGPDGSSVLIYGNVGGSAPVQDVSFTITDDSPDPIPSPLVSGSFHPTVNINASLTPPAPQGPYPITLSTFNGMDPNGTWSLYVIDSAGGHGATINGGWFISLFVG